MQQTAGGPAKDFSEHVAAPPMPRSLSPELLIAVVAGAAMVVIGLALVVAVFLIPAQVSTTEARVTVTAAYWSPERKSVVVLLRNEGGAPTYVTRVLVDGVTCNAPGTPSPSSPLHLGVGEEARIEVPAGHCGIVTGLAKSYAIELEISGGPRVQVSVTVY